MKTDEGVVLEFQNSPMPPDELRAREAFYGCMIWIVNAAPFRSRFHILSPLPDPASELAKDAVFCEERARWLGKVFWRRSENPGYETASMFLMRSKTEIADEIAALHVGHHLFEWERRRDVWFTAQAPVLFDLGDDVVWALQRYDDRGLLCVQRVTKSSFLSLHGGQEVGQAPAQEI